MKYILGLDSGVNSIGWAALLLNKDGQPCGLLDAGVRIFEPGMELDDNHVKAESRAAERRAKRMTRRQLCRRRRRIAGVRHLLQKYNLLPPEENFAAAIAELDAGCRARLKAEGVGDDPHHDHLLPYLLRKQALDKTLSAQELGRALYHLAQRRGFLSNRREGGKKDEETGKVKSGIKELREKMEAKNARTLGEYLASLNPAEESVRRIYTARDLFRQEFNRICEQQQEHITPTLREELQQAIFFQRPLKSAAGMVGKCEFLPNEKRAPWNRLEAQESRILKNVNHLVVCDADLSERKLDPEERKKLLEALSVNKEMSFAAIRKLLVLPRSSRFTIEKGGEKKLPGNSINAKLHTILGSFWDDAAAELRENILQDLRSYNNEEALKRRLMKYGIPKEKAATLSEYTLPEGYCPHSLKALRRLLPPLREGKSYSEAVQEVFPETFTNSGNSLMELPWPPPGELRNPLVSRILHEMRAVINAVVKEYGKPAKIRVELAREAKNSEKERSRISLRNREREKQRELARKALEEAGIANPRAADIEKYLLAEECHWLCPYTGKTISVDALFGSSPEFDVEHIIPYSRCMDNSFANKTLCHHHENRSIKKNFTPFEAYRHDRERYERILERVKQFGVSEKLRRFQMDDTAELEEFSNRMLNDTRYASKLVSNYAGLLYGGIVDASGKRRVEAGSGNLTALIRSVLDFNAFLNTGNRKERNDHRHHAVDAIAIALTTPALVKHVSDFFNDPEGNFKDMGFWRNMRRAITLDASWPGYDSEIRAKLESMLISHHTRNRVRGALHNETIYGKERVESGVRHKRVELEALSEKDIPNIVDHAVRRAVEEKLAELGAKSPDIFKNKDHLPRLKNGHPVKRTKIKITKNTVRIGEGDSARYVDPSNNHHMVIVDLLDEAGNVIGHEGYVVTLLEARKRLRNGIPLIQREFPDLEKGGRKLRQRYRIVLMKGDILYTREEKDETENYRVLRDIPQSKQLSYVSLNDARKKKEIKTSGQWYSAMPGTLVAKMTGKFLIDPLGRPRRNNA